MNVCNFSLVTRHAYQIFPAYIVINDTIFQGGKKKVLSIKYILIFSTNFFLKIFCYKK